MNTENKGFRHKTQEELDAQLNLAEEQLGEKLVSEGEREESLTLPVKELKERYPDEYQKYLKQLRIGGKQVEVGEVATVQTYTNEEVKMVQDAMAGKAKLSKELFDKLNSDENVRRYSMAIFFPVIRERIAKGEQPQVYVLPTGGRQRALKVDFTDKAYAVKSLENSNEREIALVAEELGCGPKQFETIDHNLTEEFIEGTLIAKLDPETCTPEFMERLGKQIGEGIIKLHGRNIVINDQLLRDDMGKCHTIVTEGGVVCFIDFGAAVDLSNYPNLTDEEFFLLMRSDALASMSMHGLSDDKLSMAIERYAKSITRQFPSKEDLMKARDYQLINEGLGFISDSLPNVDSLARGISGTLKN